MKRAKQIVLDLISNLLPFDSLELQHKDNAAAWVTSGVPIFRIAKPDTPPKHLVSYFVLFDEKAEEVLLIDHINSQLWLPAGGHVEIDEDPQVTVSREAREELGVSARFDTVFGSRPLFITVTKTVGANIHTDVSLWYVIRGDKTKTLTYEQREMKGYKWWTFRELLDTPVEGFDPYMHRFIQKMQAKLTQTQTT